MSRSACPQSAATGAHLQPLGNYQRAVVHGDLVFVSGHTCRRQDGSAIRGILGADLDVAAGQFAASLAAENVLDAVRREVPYWQVRPISVHVFVRSTADFDAQSTVADGASAVLDPHDGSGCTRTAISVPALPGGAAVEVEAIFARVGQGPRPRPDGDDLAGGAR